MLTTVLGAMQDGKTDYKSLTVAENATAEEFMDFYLDDDSRCVWVSPSPLRAARLHQSAACIAFMCHQVLRILGLNLISHDTLQWELPHPVGGIRCRFPLR